MLPPSSKPTLDTHVRVAWQEQMTAAGNTPGLLPELMQRRQELLPRFAVCYTQLRALPRRVRRALQRKWKHSLAGVALLLALGQEPVLAATIDVTGGCNLVNAIRAANIDTATGGCPKGSGADTIRLPVGSTQTLTTINNSTYGPTGLPVVSSTITIEGRNSTIRRVSSDPDLFRIFAINGTGNLTLKDTTITGGITTSAFPVSYAGGGVLNNGNLTLQNSTISGNSAFAVGGGVFNSGVLTLDRSTIANNGIEYGGGGGVANAGGTLIIQNSTVSGNIGGAFGSGGGVANGGTLTIQNSTISDNRGGSGYGGGGGVANSGTATIEHSTLSGNVGDASLFGGDGGGGVLNGGSMTIRNSTLSGNSGLTEYGRGGGGVLNSGTLTIENSTLSGNRGDYNGGGAFNEGSLTIINSTVSGNVAKAPGAPSGYDSGSGAGIENAGTLTLIRTLVSGNTAASYGGPEIHSYPGTVTANNFNLFGHDGNAGVSGFTPGATDVVPLVALTAILNPTLANNGGSTLTHALVPSSPALDAVATGCPPPNTDQRGVSRPQGLHCDIGAVEAQGFCINQMATIVGTPGNDVLTGTPSRDVMLGLGGNDTLLGLGDRDVLCGNEGNDTLRGGFGLDFLDGGTGNDQLFGEAGPDYLRGKEGRDQLLGGPGNDELLGGPDDDVLNGEADQDVCDGGRHVQGDTALNCEVVGNVP